MTTKQRCYYEVLGIEKIAKSDEIKISYRKLALLWHPDKNQHQITLAEEKFKEINNAYQILSDPNERKWYDDHRDSILRGGRGGDDDSDDEDDINLWAYFSPNVYSSYNDNDENGFYMVYDRIFEIIHQAEYDADNTVSSPPCFGTSKTPIAEVLRFYNYWKEFCTHKKFASVDKYNMREAPNRYVKRLMEKENQSDRSRARKSYNEKVRHLAKFVYNRDRRIAEYQQQQVELETQRQKEEEERRQKAEEERREAMRKYKEEKQAEYERDKAAGVYDEVHQEEDIQEFYCIACEKSFKSDRQLQNHENSNKHKQQLAKMRASVAMENELLFDDDVSIGSGNNTPSSTTPINNNSDDDQDNSFSSNNNSSKSKKKKKKSKKVINNYNDDDDESDTSDQDNKQESTHSDYRKENVHGLKTKNNKKNNKKKSKQQLQQEQEEEEKKEKKKNNKNKKRKKKILISVMRMICW